MTSFLELPRRVWDLAVVISSRVEPVLMTGHTAGLRVPLNHIALCRCRGCCSSPPSSPTSLWHTILNAAISSVIKPLSLVEGIPLWLWADLSAADGRSHEGESFMCNHKAIVCYNEIVSRSIKQHKDIAWGFLNRCGCLRALLLLNGYWEPPESSV